MATEDKPYELKSVKKIMELPIVAQGAKHVYAIYQNPTLWTWTKAKEGAKAAGTQAVAPYVEQHIRDLDERVANAIDGMTERAPILKEQPHVILNNAKETVQAKIPEMRNAVEPHVQSVKEKGSTLLNYGYKGYEGVSAAASNIYGQWGGQAAAPPVVPQPAPPPPQTSSLWEMIFGK